MLKKNWCCFLLMLFLDDVFFVSSCCFLLMLMLMLTLSCWCWRFTCMACWQLVLHASHAFYLKLVLIPGPVYCKKYSVSPITCNDASWSCRIVLQPANGGESKPWRFKWSSINRGYDHESICNVDEASF